MNHGKLRTYFQGDSGGPLIYNNNAEPSTLIGIANGHYNNDGVYMMYDTPVSYEVSIFILKNFVCLQ